MFSFIIRRLAYSLLIIGGVMVVTFLLFRVAAGDPAAALLGKNPTPDMVESMRAELGSDKPLFWGKWCLTEAFSSSEFKEKRAMPGISIPPEGICRDGALELDCCKAVVFRRNFALPGTALRGKVCWSGEFEALGRKFAAAKPETATLELPSGLAELALTAGKGLRLYRVVFFKAQKSSWDSQFFDAMGELVSFQSSPPFIVFFDFGRTLSTREPVSQVIWRGLGPSLLLMLPIFFGELLIGIVLALLAAAFKGSWID